MGKDQDAMRRRPDWPERMAEEIHLAVKRPFAWGEHDCVLWACRVIEAVTGLDPSAPMRQEYRDASGARRVLEATGADSLRALVERVCEAQGFAPIAPSEAQRGDAVLVPSGLRSWPLALGICGGRHVYIPCPQGLGRVNLADAVAAWRVG